ncbi:MAG: pilus assembly protein, partial [Burkholderiales bacterium]
MIAYLIRIAIILWFGLLVGVPVRAAPISFSEIPLYLSARADPNVLFNMSVEWPTSGNAYNDHIDTGSGGLCPGRPANENGFAIGQCYFATKTYIGYFDPNKCYQYSSNEFRPSSATNSLHQCSGKWSGNFLNWVTMTAIDEFRYALTGGNRITDTATTTVLQRAYIDRTPGSGSFPVKKISSTATTVGSGTIPGVAPSTVTPYSDPTIYIRNVQNIVTGTSTPTATPTPGFTVGTILTAASPAINRENNPLLAKVKVCDPAQGLESNCKTYGTNYKPEGLIQNNSHRMRFALTSYLLDNLDTRDGGVLRSKMKYTGPEKYVAGTGNVPNTNKEWSETDGTFISNPDPADASASSVTNSGVINYINKFGERGYKGFDQIGELFYEGLRYFKKLPPTPEYTAGATAAMKDGFPAIDWGNDDPIQAYCQKNFIVGINDANPWLDKKLPGTFFNTASGNVTMINSVPRMLVANTANTCVTSPAKPACSGATATDRFCTGAVSGTCYMAMRANDYNEPSNADGTINVTSLTNTVGALEGINGSTWTSTGNSSSAGTVSTYTYQNDSIGGGPGTFDNTCTTNKTGLNLGEVLSTCGNTNKENTYYIAGLAYYANTQDIRSDLQNKQTIATYMIDTQEFSTNPLDGPKNMLWLAGKYGGFIDSNNDGNPNVSSSGTNKIEWDADGDGIPDNYVFANNPDKMVAGLTNAFNDIINRTSSASSVAANSTALNTGSHIYQARYTSGDWSGQLLSYSISTSGVINPIAEWDTGQLINSQTPGSRVILTFDDAPLIGQPDGIPFQWLSLNLGQQSALNTNASGTLDLAGLARLNWIRGDSTNESPSGLAFRKRATSKLGDIINSNPTYVGPPNAGYPDASYATFRSANSSRTPIIYVGANDGMLHVIDASCTPSALACTPTANSGREVMAYIPRPVYKNLSKLTSPNYNGLPSAHRYFVDSTPTFADVQIGGTWKTILVGGLGAGGQGIYALDVTDPSSFSEGNASSIALWEFTDQHDKDLGYTFSQPQVAKMANGKWAVIFGNGYNNSESDGASTTSTTGRAVLYILFIEQGTDGAWTVGTDFVKLDTMVGSTGTPNGLATPFVADVNGNGIADYVYVGDLQGNMWKFDVTNSNPASWGA